MSGSTISTTITTGVTLGTSSGDYPSPLTITSTGSISSPAYTNGVYGAESSAAQSVYNFGSIHGGFDGIDLNNSNWQEGLASGNTVINAGTIKAHYVGVFLAGGGTMTNETGGFIEAGSFSTAVQIDFATGTLFNAGTIYSHDEYGVLIVPGGAVTNADGYIYGGETGIGFLTGGGKVTNTSTGTISGGNYGVLVKSGLGSVYNTGFISGASLAGVALLDGGSITNAAGGDIYGYQEAVDLTAGGTFTDSSTGTISGHNNGIFARGGNAAVYNAGFVESTKYVAVDLTDGGTVTNAVGGVVSGGIAGVYIGGAQGSVSNAGTIGGTYGVVLLSGGTITNDAGGTISSDAGGAVYIANGPGSVANSGVIESAGSYGINLAAGGSVVNAGLISGATDALLFGSAASVLKIEAGASFSGAVIADANYSNTLELGTMGDAGTLDMGDSFSGFSSIVFNTGSVWQLGGEASNFDDGQTITGFTKGDSLLLEGTTASLESYVSGSGLILVDASDPSKTYTLDVTGSFTTNDFIVTDVAGGTEVVLGAVTCFVRGTLIRTDRGEVAIEALAIGDEIVTAYGAVQRIKWIGRRGYDGRFIQDNHLALPVCIKADAIADSVPARDLFVSPGHGIFVDGVLIPAWRLINGVSITQVAAVEHVEYFHIELEEHDIILAENCPTESFLDLELRSQFQNAGEFRALYPDAVPSMFRLPRVDGGFVLQSIHRNLAMRAGVTLADDVKFGPLQGYVDMAGPEFITGWAQNIEAPEVPVCLDILLDGKRIARVLANEYRADLHEAGLGSGCHAFVFKCAAGMVGNIEIRRVSDQGALPLTGALLAQAA